MPYKIVLSLAAEEVGIQIASNLQLLFSFMELMLFHMQAISSSPASPEQFSHIGQDSFICVKLYPNKKKTS